ncbi:hypothetical protein D7Y26_03430 [Stenotrophomonas maltophilia]|nr:hypothetical protein [Stenotrophomonas maltophilia]MBA0322671.1 hypothetical protein [Stenotrophomonas maltophilia]
MTDVAQFGFQLSLPFFEHRILLLSKFFPLKHPNVSCQVRRKQSQLGKHQVKNDVSDVRHSRLIGIDRTRIANELAALAFFGDDDWLLLNCEAFRAIELNRCQSWICIELFENLLNGNLDSVLFFVQDSNESQWKTN